MIDVVSIKFKSCGKVYYFAPNGTDPKEGDRVVVETANGRELAICSQGVHAVPDDRVIQPLQPVIRVATAADLRVAEQNKKREAEAFEICKKKIADHGLDMKLVEVECNFEGNKITFFFTSDGRVDFRELVKDLAGVFRSRIELRQIGVRDEAKMLGGLGICGRPFCCSQFLSEFYPVSTKMAKVQNMSLNPKKISGCCGRLMCCLRYEQEAYEDLVKTVPKNGAFVETPDGAGTVSSVNLLRQQIHVRLESDPETPKCYHNCEICVVRNGKGKRPEGYVEPPLEELAKLRKPVEDDIPEPTRAPASPLAAALEAVFNGEVPQMEGMDLNQGQEEETERRSRRNRSRRARGGSAPRKENRETEAPKEEKPARSEKAPQEKQERGERPKREFRPRGDRPPRAPKPEKTEREGQSAPMSGEPSGEGKEKRSSSFNRRRRRPRGNGGGKPQGGQE